MAILGSDGLNFLVYTIKEVSGAGGSRVWTIEMIGECRKGKGKVGEGEGCDPRRVVFWEGLSFPKGAVYWEGESSPLEVWMSSL